MDFYVQIAEWAWPIILGMIKTHRNKQTKVLIKPFSFWNNLCSVACKGRIRFSLDEKSLTKRSFRIVIFKNSYLWLDWCFYVAFFYISLISPSDFEKYFYGFIFITGISCALYCWCIISKKKKWGLDFENNNILYLALFHDVFKAS